MQNERKIGNSRIDLRTHSDHPTESARITESLLHSIVTTGGPHLEIHFDGKVVTLQKDDKGAVHLDPETLEELIEGIKKFGVSIRAKQ